MNIGPTQREHIIRPTVLPIPQKIDLPAPEPQTVAPAGDPEQELTTA